MVLVALEQSEPPGRRLVDDDLAARFLPAPTRWLVAATPPNLMRRLTMAAMEREGPGLWAGMACRKRYIADRVAESLDGNPHSLLGDLKVARIKRRFPRIEKRGDGEHLIVERAFEPRAADAMQESFRLIPGFRENAIERLERKLAAVLAT